MKSVVQIFLLMAALSAICAISGCSHNADPRLLSADELMEERPDSALSILETYTGAWDADDYDGALHGLLLTQARYKNFIDETDDSLISASADYFIKHDDKALASRALFHAGMIQMNSNRLGDAAVSFTKGLDLARDSKSYMWEGRCAQGLFMIYCKLMNTSEQIRYAEEAYGAYSKGGFDSWADYARLDLARAYNNNGQYEKSIGITKDIEVSAREKKDILVLSETLQLRGVSTYVLGRYKESLESYSMVYDIKPSILTDNDKHIIEILQHELDWSSCQDSVRQFKGVLEVGNEPVHAFIVLAREGKYKEAYESLERYKNTQDSVLSMIIKNNVSESVNQYERMRSSLKEAQVKNERMLYWVVILVIVAVLIIVFWRYREYVHKSESRRLKAEADMESLRSDLLAQYEKTRINMDDASEIQGQAVNEDFTRIIRQKYSEVNSLCDEYYQSRHSKKDNEKATEKVNSIVSGLTDKEGIDNIISYVDGTTDGLYSSFKRDFFDISEENFRLFLYLLLGFNARTISVILGVEVSVVYNRKSRLRAKVSRSSAVRKDEYLRLF